MSPIMPVTPANSTVWRIIHFPLTLLVIAVVAIIAAVLLSSGISHAIPHAGNDWLALLVSVLVALVFVAMYAAFVRLIERRPRIDEFAPRGWAGELGGGLLTGAVLFSAVVAVIALGGGYHIVGTRSVAVLVPVLALAIVSGVTEEIVFRGLFFRLIERWLGTWIALAASAAFFGLGHIANPHSSWLAATAIALEAGIMLAGIYLITRRLWAAIGVHAAWNFVQGGIFGIPVSGGAVDGVLRPRISGSDLLTGGAFGAEASLPAIIVATAFGILVVVIAHRRGRFVAPFWLRNDKRPAAGAPGEAFG